MSLRAAIVDRHTGLQHAHRRLRVVVVEVEDRELDEGLGEARVDLNRPAQRGVGLFGLVQRHEDRPQPVVHHVELGVDAQRLLVGRLGHVDAVEHLVALTQLVVVAGLVGLQRDHPVEVTLGVVPALHVLVDLRQVIVGPRKGVVLPHRRLEVAQRRRVEAIGELLDPRVHVANRPVAVLVARQTTTRRDKKEANNGRQSLHEPVLPRLFSHRFFQLSTDLSKIMPLPSSSSR